MDSTLPTAHAKQKRSFCSLCFVELLCLPQVAESLGYFLQSNLHVFIQPMHLAGSVGEWGCAFWILQTLKTHTQSDLAICNPAQEPRGLLSLEGL